MTGETPVLPADEPQVAAPGDTPVSAPAPKKHSHRFEWLWLTSIQSLATTIVIAVFVITFIVQAFQIPSESMENTLLIGDYLLVDKVHYAKGGIWGGVLPYSEIQRGEIVVFRYPVHPAQHFVKRVVGVPGDRIRLVNKQVYVNGAPAREPYVVHHSPMPDAYRDDFPAPNYVSANVEARWWLEMRKVIKKGELVVPQDMYFVLGDNRDESLDSRYWGFVPRENVIGRPLVIYWSFQSNDVANVASATDGKLSRLAGVFTRFYHDTRWDRTLRLVR